MQLTNPAISSFASTRPKNDDGHATHTAYSQLSFSHAAENIDFHATGKPYTQHSFSSAAETSVKCNLRGVKNDLSSR